MKKTYTASTMVAELVDKYPPLRQPFSRLGTLRACSYRDEKRISDHLTQTILFLFEINDISVEIVRVPQKGWGVGCCLPAGIEGVEVEVKPMSHRLIDA